MNTLRLPSFRCQRLTAALAATVAAPIDAASACLYGLLPSSVAMALRFTSASSSCSRRPLQKISFFCSFLVLGGCAQHAQMLSARDTLAEQNRNIVANAPAAPQLAQLGLKALAEGRASEAVTLFSAAIKFDPKNSDYHALLGTAYHALLRSGQPDKHELALAGYALAIRYDPMSWLPHLQTGRLHAEAGEWTAARDAFILALERVPDKRDALYGLAQSAWYLNDTGLALWTTDQLAHDGKIDARTQRIMALVAARIGDRAAADLHLAAYGKLLENSQEQVDYLAKRLEVILREPIIPNSLADKQASASPAPSAKLAAPENKPSATPVATAARPTWYRCDITPSLAGQAVSPAQQAAHPPQVQGINVDEGVTMPPLPAPCPGDKPPPMALLEVSMLASTDVVSRNIGINLLDGLSLYLGAAQNATRAADANGIVQRTISNTTSASLGGVSTATAIRYSLNIANTGFLLSEFLARPTLLILDRTPATFFSGANVTIGLAGTAGSSSMLSDKPVGVSLTATPTFLDDETLMLALRVTRSAITNDINAGSFSQSFSTTRNSLSTNVLLHYGETLILSGMLERTVSNSTSGTPLLQDIPLLQYLFRNDQKMELNREILTIVTPRRLIDANADAAADPLDGKTISRHRLSATVEEYVRQTHGKSSSVDMIARGLSANRLFKAPRRGDVSDDGWHNTNRIKRFVDDIKNALFF